MKFVGGRGDYLNRTSGFGISVLGLLRTRGVRRRHQLSESKQALGQPPAYRHSVCQAKSPILNSKLVGEPPFHKG